jgi:hypothetical protein
MVMLGILSPILRSLFRFTSQGFGSRVDFGRNIGFRPAQMRVGIRLTASRFLLFQVHVAGKLNHESPLEIGAGLQPGLTSPELNPAAEIAKGFSEDLACDFDKVPPERFGGSAWNFDQNAIAIADVTAALASARKASSRAVVASVNSFASL